MNFSTVVNRRRVTIFWSYCCFLLFLLLQISATVTVREKLSTGELLRTQLCFAYPRRVNMYLRGEANVLSDPGNLNWNRGIALVPSATSDNHYCIWVGYTDDKATKNLQVKVLIDDADWSIGSNFNIVLPRENGRSITLYPWFYTYQGTVSLIQRVFSPQLNNTRNVWMYLPPSYYENTLKPHDNVLVMHDGQNLFDPNSAFGNVAWMCQDTVDEHVSRGNMEEVVMVGVENTGDRMNELTYSYDPSQRFGGKGDLYLDFIQQTVLPLVVSKYGGRVRITRDRLGILGSSLGGLISCYAGWTRHDVYGKAGCMSSSFWWNNQDFNRTIITRPVMPSNQDIYLDSGNQGPSKDGVAETLTVRKSMSALPNFLNRNSLYYYLDDGAQHNEYYWGRRFYIPMTKLYPVKPIMVSSTTQPK